MKKLLLFIAILIAALTTFSQTDPLRDKLDLVFQNVNKDVIPTGYLKEYGAELMPIHVFNGVLTDSNLIYNLDAFRAAYTDLATARIQSALPAMANIATVNAQIDNVSNSVAAPVAILYGAYASLREDALSQNLFTVSNEQVFDVQGRNQNPYLTNSLFAAASIRKSFTNTVSFTWNPALYYTNTAATVAAVRNKRKAKTVSFYFKTQKMSSEIFLSRAANYNQQISIKLNL